MKYLFIILFFMNSSFANINNIIRGSNLYKIIQPESVEQSPIIKPYGIWLKLMEFSGKRNYCLWYKTPFKENAGELKLLIKKAGVCNQKNIAWYQGKVTKLIIDLNETKLKISYLEINKKKSYDLFFINMLNDKKYELFDSPARKKYLSGLHLLE